MTEETEKGPDFEALQVMVGAEKAAMTICDIIGAGGEVPEINLIEACFDGRHAAFIRAYLDAPPEAGFNHVSARLEGETPRYDDLPWRQRAAVDVYRAVILAGDAAGKLHAPRPEPEPAPPPAPVDIEDTILRGHPDMLATVSYAKPAAAAPKKKSTGSTSKKA